MVLLKNELKKIIYFERNYMKISEMLFSAVKYPLSGINQLFLLGLMILINITDLKKVVKRMKHKIVYLLTTFYIKSAFYISVIPMKIKI